MKKFLFLCFTLCLLLAITETALAQRTRPSDREDVQRRKKEMSDSERLRTDMDAKQDALHSLESLSLPRPIADTRRERQLEINRNLKQLNDMSNSLMSNVQTMGSDLKSIADLAGKIAKVSKHLRQSLDLGDNKNRPAPFIPAAESPRAEQIRQLAESIDKLVDIINATQTEASVDASRIQETNESLQSIESQACILRTLARAKN
jgi:methyl-accepting chemotaxis protein